MSKSLQQHGPKEVTRQLHLRMKNSGLDTVKVTVTRGAGKHKIDFTGSAPQVTEARKILAAWA
jgi:N-methylhydantoinase B/oxoprolinase/acetone carboxylase alpha subunit